MENVPPGIYCMFISIRRGSIGSACSIFAIRQHKWRRVRFIKITEEQAIQAAITNQSIQRSDVEAVELDEEDGRTVFSVEIVKDNQDYDVKVDAQTGEVIKVEPDSA